MSTLAAGVRREARRVLVAALVGVGVLTAALLHARAVAAVDAALLAAAHEAAHSPEEERWAVEHSESPVRTRLLAEVPPEAERAMRHERPVYVDRGDARVLYLPVHPESDHDEEEDEGDDEALRVVEARTARPGLARTVGPFLLAWAVTGTGLGLLADAVLRRRLERALGPLAEATRTIAGAERLEAGRRLPAGGPDEVATLVAATNALLDRVEAAGRAQSRFTAEAAHELRTPLAVLRGELDVALRRPREVAAYAAVLASAREEVDRLAALVDALVAFARVDSGQAAWGREPVRAGELVDDALRAERATGVEVDRGEDPELVVHRGLATVALGNLVRNALRHGAPPVRVRVRGGDRVEFLVSDGGPGIPVAEREAVFDRFVRGGRARRDDAGGLGLGLALARAIARAHGGDCVASDEGVRLVVPAA